MVYLHDVGSPEIGLLNRNLDEVLGPPRRDGKDISFAELDAMITPEDR